MAPLAKVAVNVAMSSFSTGSVTSLTGPPAAWPTAAPSGTGRSADHGRQHRAAHALHRPAQELADVHQVGADVRQRPGPGRALIAPADRGVGAEAVVAPVVPVEVHRRPQHAAGHLLADGVDGRRPAEREPDRRDPVRLCRPVHHGLPVGHGRGQRLLAEHVLARVQQSLHDLAVQRVAHHHADRVDVGRLGNGLPARLRALVAVPPGDVDGERLVRVGDGHQPHVRQVRVEHGGRGPVAAGVRPAGHPGTDHRHPDRRCAHRSPSRRVPQAASESCSGPASPCQQPGAIRL